MVRKTKKCRYCSEDILADAIKCRFCGEMVGDSEAPEAGPAEIDPQSDRRLPLHQESGTASVVQGSARVFQFIDDDSHEHSVSGLSMCIKFCRWGLIRPNTLIRDNQDCAWQFARQIPELSECFSQNPSTPEKNATTWLPYTEENGHIGVRTPVVPVTPRNDIAACGGSGLGSKEYLCYIARYTLMALAVITASVAYILSYELIPARGFITGFVRSIVILWFPFSVWKWTKRFTD